MFKTIAMIIFCSILGVHMINGLKCYACESAACQNPASGDAKDCGDSTSNGKDFVGGATSKDKNDPYGPLAGELKAYVTSIGANETLITWDTTTQWVNFFSMLDIK